MELLELDHPLGHGRPPEPVHGFIIHEHLSIELPILLEREGEVLLYRDDVVPVHTVASDELNVAVERIFDGS